MVGIFVTLTLGDSILVALRKLLLDNDNLEDY